MTAMAPSELGVDSLAVAALRAWVESFAEEVAGSRDLLTRLDSAIGDADHGTNLDRGLKAVVAALAKDPPTTADRVFKTTGITLVSTVGGASGPLFGTLFLRMAGQVGVTESIDAGQFAHALRAGLDGIVARGRAEAEDKTMYDALAPACQALDSALASGRSLAGALAAATAAADAGRDATTPLPARKGRASYLGERGVGHQDPGATSMAMLIAAAARVLG